MPGIPSSYLPFSQPDLDHARLSHDAASPQGQGLLCGTAVATPDGWRPVEALSPGDCVLTMSHDFQIISDVRRRVLWPDGQRIPPILWPVTLPAGAIGNAYDVDLLPAQQVLVDPGYLGAHASRGMSLLTAVGLEPIVDTQRRIPRHARQIVNLQFLHDEIIYIDGDLLVPCPRQPVTPRDGVRGLDCVPGATSPQEGIARAA